MRGEAVTKRTGSALAAIAVVLGVLALVFVAPASAFHSKNASREDQIGEGAGEYEGFDPMETSVPYVAWRGEEVRLVKCFDPEYFAPASSGDPDEGGIPIVASEADETGEWGVIDWSGDPHVWPQFFDDNDKQTRVFFPTYGDQAGRGCFAIDITSHKPGIAIVKLKIDDGRPSPGGVGSAIPGEGDPTAVHQFNVIWMEFRDARLRNLEGGVGGPLGPITENPGRTNRVGVVVQGRVPLNAQFTRELNAQLPAEDQFTPLPEFGDEQGESSAIFPEDYPVLARTSLAHVSWALQKANNGVEGDDNTPNETCDEPPDTGTLENPVVGVCAGDVGEPTFIPEPDYLERGGSFAAGNFWDIHDSTGPYNTGVYGPGKPQITDECPVPPTGVAADHNEVCHVDQEDPTENGDPDCDDDHPEGGGGPNDTVDNCDRGEWDAFSRVFHDVSGGSDTEPTIGPYSPTRPDETMLSDSNVNAHDAPMPAALVIAAIAGDADTIGFLSAVDKHKVYNRGGAACTDPEAAHCVTGPFSGAYIPPSPTMENAAATGVPDDGGPLTDDRDTASGVHGAIANNFNGYLPVFYPQRPLNRGLYHYWDIVQEGDRLTGVANGCDDFRTPSGLQELWLYTDEHGEAQFQFNAGTGFNFDPRDTPGVEDPFLNSQGGCVPVGLLGTAEITVNARYPNQPQTAAGVRSNELQKRVESLFRKGIVCVPKAGEEETKAICVVFARSISGTPLNEVVCISVTGPNNVAVRDFDPDPSPTVPGVGLLCVDTDDIGISGLPDAIEADVLAAAPFLNSTFGTETVLVIGTGTHLVTADFVEERIEVQTNIRIPPGVSPPTTTTTTTATTPTTPTTTAITPGTTTQAPPQTLPPATVTTQQTTTAATTTRATTTSRPSTTPRRVTTVKAKKKIKIRKKVKKVKRKGVCIIRGRVVRPCVRGNG